jgi:transposase
VLLTADRRGAAEIMRRTGLSKPSVWRWQQRYIEAGGDDLLCDKTRPSRIPKLAEEKVAEVVRLTLDEPPRADATHWTMRAMAAKSGVSMAMVHRIWQENGLAPHRFRQFELSNDPAFASKVEDVIGLYVDPPAHAVVLSIDEQAINTFIQTHNEKPKPFAWRADPKTIIAAAKRGHQALETIH